MFDNSYKIRKSFIRTIQFCFYNYFENPSQREEEMHAVNCGIQREMLIETRRVDLENWCWSVGHKREIMCCNNNEIIEENKSTKFPGNDKSNLRSLMPLITGIVVWDSRLKKISSSGLFMHHLHLAYKRNL